MPQTIGEPFKIHVNKAESAANTLTVQEIETQLAKVGSHIQALEIKGWNLDVQPPDPEPGQVNAVQVAIARDTDRLADGGTFYGKEDEDVVDSIQVDFSHEDAAGTEASNPAQHRTWRVNLDNEADPPVYILKKSFDVGVKGIGNAGAKSVRGYLIGQLVRLSADELAQSIVLEELYD